ncbi:DUF1497 domain-containing protein [Lactococcus cremoris]
MGYYDTRNEARRISKLASQNISSEQTKKEFELDSQNKFNQEMQEDFHKRIQELGYTQYKFNYITDYAKQIDKSATRMEFIWQNRGGFKDNVDVAVALENALENIERQIEEFKGYLKPFDKEDNQ